MSSPSSNIEPLARAICERKLRRTSTSETELAADVERYWHCVAAQIEAGFIDDAGLAVAHDFEDGVDAYVDWRKRHPEFKLPARQST
ncbi:MAG: hypothetical protein ACKVP7_04575 [Hyphomicrobiaceae bacterium]